MQAPSKAPDSLWEIIFSGGVPGITIMLVLIGLSLTAVYLIVEHLLTIRRRELLPEGLAEQVRALLEDGRLVEAEELCAKRSPSSLLPYVLAHGLAEAGEEWRAVEKALEDSLAEQAARLFRKIEYLSVLANIAPMVGLLGTVVGMVVCFHQVAKTQGAAGAAELASGIYQALVTTVAGLIIAIPALGAFALFRNRVDELIAEAAYLSQHAVAPLKRRPPKPIGQPRQAPPPPPHS